MIGFEWTYAKFFWYLFFMYFTLLYFTFYGMMTVAVTPNHNIAAIVSSAFYALWNLFSGFIIPKTVSLLQNVMMSTIIRVNILSETRTPFTWFIFFFLLFFLSMGLCWVPFFPLVNREFRCGGDGIVTYVQFLGHYMDWLLHNSEILRQI